MEDQGILPLEDVNINNPHSEIAIFPWNAPGGHKYVILREQLDGVRSATSWKDGPIAAAKFCMASLTLEKHRAQKDKTILAACFAGTCTFEYRFDFIEHAQAGIQLHDFNNHCVPESLRVSVITNNGPSQPPILTNSATSHASK